MKVLFDATVLVDGNDMKEERRGIYFVAKNILCEMCILKFQGHFFVFGE